MEEKENRKAIWYIDLWKSRRKETVKIIAAACRLNLEAINIVTSL